MPDASNTDSRSPLSVTASKTAFLKSERSMVLSTWPFSARHIAVTKASKVTLEDAADEDRPFDLINVSCCLGVFVFKMLHSVA